MHYHCAKSCGTCEHGNYTSWAFSDGRLSAGGGLCLDLNGQLPSGHGGGNVLHALPCDATAPTQRWAFNGTGGAIQSAPTSRVEAAVDDESGTVDGAPCLQAFNSWLWDRPIVNTQGCDATKPGSSQQWSLHPNGTLANHEFGCVEVTDKQGPPTTIWLKPLDLGGKVALLAVNGADMAQTIALDFAALLGPDFGGLVRGKAWATRDVYGAADLGVRRSLTKEVAPHDCVLLVLVPA